MLCLPRPERFRQPEAWAPSPRVRCAFSLRGPSARRRSGLRKSLDRNRGLFAGWEGVASRGLSLPLSPPPCLLPPAGMGGLFSGVSQSLCFANRRQCVRPVNFSLLSHSLKKLPPTTLRAFGTVLTLSNAARSSPFCPHLLVAGAGVWSCWELLLGT